MEGTRKNTNLLIFTGGHHTSALVTALSARRHGWQPVWIGHHHAAKNDTSLSAEYHDVTAAGIPFYHLKSGKIFGSGSILDFFAVLAAIYRSLRLLQLIRQKFRPSHIGIISFGGYLAVPVVLAGWLTGISAITHEQTVVGGGANRFLAFFVKKIALTWPASAKYFPPAKSVVTGLPLRPEIIQVKRSSVKNLVPKLFITGGKQGSHSLNSFVFSHLETLLQQYEIVHQTGSNTAYRDDLKALELKSQLSQQLSRRYETAAYFPATRIAAILSDTDLVISRSGAHITYELGYLGLPAVLIPLAWSSRNEQSANAQLLSDAGIAIILSQSELNLPRLLQSIQRGLQLKPDRIPGLVSGTPALQRLIDQTFLPTHV